MRRRRNKGPPVPGEAPVAPAGNAAAAALFGPAPPEGFQADQAAEPEQDQLGERRLRRCNHCQCSKRRPALPQRLRRRHAQDRSRRVVLPWPLGELQQKARPGHDGTDAGKAGNLVGGACSQCEEPAPAVEGVRRAATNLDAVAEKPSSNRGKPRRPHKSHFLDLLWADTGALCAPHSWARSLRMCLQQQRPGKLKLDGVLDSSKMAPRSHAPCKPASDPSANGCKCPPGAFARAAAFGPHKRP